MILFPPILISLIYFFTVPSYLKVHPSYLFYSNTSSLPGHFFVSRTFLLIYH
nr:MAG TPA: hypothetical protein [Bacteriophage sp.]